MLCYTGAIGGRPQKSIKRLHPGICRDQHRKNDKKDKERERVLIVSHMRKIGAWREVDKDLTIIELKQSERVLKNGKATGPDGVRPEFLKHLPDVALEQVLEIANHNCRTFWVPQQWRSTTMIPNLKKGKNASKVENYSPIALTSQLGKCVERIIGGRLTRWLKDKRKKSPYRRALERDSHHRPVPEALTADQ